MAGLGAKLFVDGEDLNAAEANGYFMDQTIMRFATTAARDAAFGGVGEPALAEGMTCYIDADNTIYSYNGGSWVKLVSSETPVGSVLLGGATFTNQPYFEVTGFSSEYQWYDINFSGVRTTSGSTVILGVLYNGATPRNSSYWGGNFRIDYQGITAAHYNQNNAGDFYGTTVESRYRGNFSMRCFFKSGEQFTYNTSGFDGNLFAAFFGGGFRSATDSWDRIRFTGFSGNISGEWSIYGRRLPA